MGCRDVHAATVLSFLCGIASVAGLFAGTLLPNWRKLRLITFNRNEKNLTIYTGLWVKCARYDGSSDCLMYDHTWYLSVDQLDLRVLQFALPLSILIAMGALLLCLIGMCNTAFKSSVPNIKLAKCLVNSAGCHLVAGLLFFLAGTVSLSPSIWAIFYNTHLNKKFEPVFTFDYAVFVTIASSGGLFMTALLLFIWLRPLGPTNYQNPEGWGRWRPMWGPRYGLFAEWRQPPRNPSAVHADKEVLLVTSLVWDHSHCS
ncbi:claudin 12 [Cricetulus griseus]